MLSIVRQSVKPFCSLNPRSFATLRVDHATIGFERGTMMKLPLRILSTIKYVLNVIGRKRQNLN